MLTVIVCALATSGLQQGNLLVNGNFTAGNTGFRSDYTFASDVGPEGNYAIGTDPHDFDTGAWSFHWREPGPAQMLVVNGSPNPNQAVWEETVPVRPHRRYTFTGWAASWSEDVFHGGGPKDVSPARLVVYVNGQALGPAFHVPETSGRWARFRSEWTAKDDPTATIRIVDENTDGVGNDFALGGLDFRRRAGR